MRYAPHAVSVAACLTFIILIALGAHVYRWELYIWNGALILWVITAGYSMALARRAT